MTIGEVIKYKRTKKGLSQKELALMVGCAEITIRQYESGSREPKQSKLEKIAEALGTTPRAMHIIASLQGEEIAQTESDFVPIAFDRQGNIVRVPVTTVDNDNKRGELLKHFSALNETGKEKAVEHVEMLAKVPEYKKDPEA